MTKVNNELIGEAVYQNKSFSLNTALDHAFARLFRGLVYPQIWEDPECDMKALELKPEDNIVCIASGGCNMMSYLTASPASITAVDLSAWHVELNRLKLLAAQEMPDHAAFYSLFGHANRAENTTLFDQYLLPAMPPETAEFWSAREKFRPRKTMFARGFYRFGALGTFLGLLHGVARVARVDFKQLLNAQTVDEQIAFFDSKIAPLYRSRFVRFIARRKASLFGLGIPPAQYDKLAADAGGDIVPVLMERTRKLFCDFPISENYFAWQALTRGYNPDGSGPLPPYLQEHNFKTISENANRVSVHNRSVTEVLSDSSARSKSVYILLDAQDWMTDDQLAHLWQEITRTSAPGARVLFRTGGSMDILPGRVPPEILSQWHYDTEESEHAFRTDRSAIYGGVHLYRKID